MRIDSKSPLASLRRWLLLALLLLAGCSAGVRLGYNNADTLLVYTIDGYIGLSPEQEQLVKERAGTLIAWHRATQLRDYAQLVETTRRRLDGPVTAADVLAFSDAINARLAAVGARAAGSRAR